MSIATTIERISNGKADGATCTPDLAMPTWTFDSRPGYGPGSSMSDVIPTGAPRQGGIPDEYKTASDEELHDRIERAKAALGDRVVVLGHFYQRDEVVRHADFLGDSFQLANAALTKPDAEAIVFCGVHFMAETADILARDDQRVILPNLAAGCSMADMADIDSVEQAWAELEQVYGTEPDADGRVPVIPVTYMNSAADLKAFCGRHGGIVCTSSNAATVLEWAFERGQRVLFFPDQHLGRNTAKAMGISTDLMPMWNPRKALGGNDEQTLLDARVVLWHGFCSVHRRFTVDQIEQGRRDHPACRSS
ncbi:quinolinate synthase NadA, partial [Curtobacterium sp. B8]|uniref:quinolinate synthase NadA n=1 Tax=Curtobacterium sp. B8 TaxID=95611 RepID=UPI0003B65982